MIFKPINFRKISEDSKPQFKIRNDDRMPLILIRQSGEAMFAAIGWEKDALIAQFNNQNDLLLWGWVGQWRTDIFQLTETDLKNHYK